MTDQQWETLLRVIRGEPVTPFPVGFIIDSPWLPGWAGMSILDYLTAEDLWFRANLGAIRQFPTAIFLPGFWAEFGMCTEPSAFGAACRWPEDEFPFAHPLPGEMGAVDRIVPPDPRRDGLPPFVLKRLEHTRARIEESGHAVRFAVTRGPLNVASFLVGNTELLTAMRSTPEAAHRLLRLVTNFLVDWLRLQAETFPAIDGVLILDDIVGFLGESDFAEFADPYLRQAFQALEVSVRFFHNDANGAVCAPHLAGMGVNLFNFSHTHGLHEMREWTGGEVALVGNIPPGDVLGDGSPEDVRRAVGEVLDSLDDVTRLVLSCGGGMPPGVCTANIRAFLQACGHACADQPAHEMEGA